MSEEDWAGFRSWLHSIAVVTFDLELGQVIENVYPVNNPATTTTTQDALSEQDKTNVCYLALPDSNSGIMGDIQFHFRIRQCPETRTRCPRPGPLYDMDAPTAIQVRYWYLLCCA